ncbi:MAG: endolytic transglycosylase MltG [Acidimicrobiia bacterium]|nr:MAG: endolytic transglycosylase MltG [Acidimicrobiia bacterium]
MRPLVITLSVLIVLGAGYIGAVRLAEWGSGLAPTDVVESPDIEPGIPVSVEIAPGSTARGIAEQLVGEGVIASAETFELAVRTAEAEAALQAGTYALETGMTAEDVIAILVVGPVEQTFWLTVPEGLRVTEILERVSSVSGLERAELEAALLDGSVSSPWVGEADALQDWEGVLFPDTYEFPRDVSPAGLLQLLADTAARRAAEVGADVAYEDLIVASLIEAEASLDEDRPKIASVIGNRLEAGMPLQIDATVLYALGERGIVLTLDDLEVDSPWNTYVIGGLPPTPIGAPGLASIEAAMNPVESDWIYYVLTSSDGAHSFTASYDEFLAFKQQAKDDGVIP